MNRTDQTLSSKETHKNILALVAACVVVTSYLAYQYYWFQHGIKLNEMYFACTSFAIATYSYLVFTWIKNIACRALSLLVSTFYYSLLFIYLYYWVLLNKPYANVKISLAIGLSLSIIYLIYATIKSNVKHRP